MAGNIKGLTLEIGGSTTKLMDALKQPAKATKELQSSLKNVNTALRFDTKNVDLLDQKQRLLKKTISSTEDELKLLKQAQAEYIASGKDIDGEEYVALEAKIALCERSLDNLRNQQNNFSGSVQVFGQRVGELGEKTTKIGEAAFKGVTVPIVAAGTAMAGLSISFEDSMAKVSTIADTTQVPIDELGDAITNLSNETGISANEIAENVYNAISAGQQTGDAVNFVSNSTKLAKAGFAEAGASLDLLTTIMNAYGLEAGEVGHVSDALIQTQNLGKTTVGELSSAMGKVIPTANAMGVSLDQLCSGYAIMTANGVATAESTTYMNSMLNELGKTGSTTDKVLREKTGKSFSQLMDSGMSLADVLKVVDDSAKEQNLTLSDMFSSSEAGKAGLILLGDGVDKFNGTLEEMKNSAGATDEAFKKLETNSFSIQKAINMVTNTAREFGDTIMESVGPMIQKACEAVKNLCQWFSNLSDGQKQLIVKIAALAAAFGPVMIGIGKVETGLSSLIKYFGSTTTWGGKLLASLKGVFGAITIGVGPLLAIVAAVAAVAGAFAYLWTTNEEFRNKMVEIWNSIVTKIKQFCERITERLNDLGFNFSDITEAIKAVWDGFCQFLAPIFEGAWKQIENVITVVLDVIFGVVSAFIALFHGDWDGFWQGIQDIADACWTYIKDTVDTVIQTIMGCVSTFLSWFGITWDWTPIQQAWDTVWKAISQIIDGVLGYIQELVAAFISLFQGDWDGFKAHIKAAWESLWNGVKQFAQTIWNAIGSTCRQVWDSIKSYVVNLWNNLLSVCQSVWNSIKQAVINPIQQAYDSVRNTFDNIKNSITNSINAAKNVVSNGVNAIKNLFNFRIQWPHIPLPHFRVSGSANPLDWLSGGLPRFSVDWYAKAMNQGMILNSPAIFGKIGDKLLGGGEAGPEAVVGVSSLKAMIESAVDRAAIRQIERSKQYVREESRSDIDYEKLAGIMISALAGVEIPVTLNVDGRGYLKKNIKLIDGLLNQLGGAH